MLTRGIVAKINKACSFYIFFYVKHGYLKDQSAPMVLSICDSKNGFGFAVDESSERGRTKKHSM